ncbi:MAG: ferric reductase-like transmembrane domain-containing protein [Candidatus Saccharimonadales bacterium]
MQPNGNRKVVLSFRPEHLIGWGVTIVLCLVPVILWARIHPLSTVQGFIPTMLNLGRVTGLIGTVMYALNLVYATRLRFLEYWFGGLNRVYIAHHVLGGLALIMLSFHPLFLALRYVTTSMKDAALLLVPNGLFPINHLFDTNSVQHAVVLQQWAIMFGVIAFWGMVALLVVTFFIKLPYRLWLFTHKFLGLAFFIGGLHIFFISSDTSRDPAMKWYILTMVLIGLVAFVYKTVVGAIFIRRYKYTVDAVKIVAGNVTQVLMSPQSQVMPYKPGQFVFVRFRNGGPGVSREWHPFSISSAPNEYQLELSVKGLGDYTNKLGTLLAGATADIEGAYGRFSYTNYTCTDQIWVGAGIGISPFLSMLKNLPVSGCKVDLYYVVKTESELIDWDKIAQHANARYGYVRVIPYIGDKQAGHLNADYIEGVSQTLSGKDFYLCGPPGMMQDLRKQLRAKGVPATSIHSEEFGMS